MPEYFRLSSCFAVSLALHTAALTLAHTRITPQPPAGLRAVQTALAATITRKPAAIPEEPAASSRILPANQATDQTADEAPINSGESPLTPTIPETVITGDIDESPLIELSIDDYFPPSLLDKRPTPIGDVDTHIDFKGMHDLVGDAEIMLLISAEGNVDQVLVTGTNLPDFIVEQAVERFSSLNFQPGEIMDLPVRSRVRIRLTPPSRDELLMHPYSAKQRAWRR